MDQNQPRNLMENLIVLIKAVSGSPPHQVSRWNAPGLLLPDPGSRCLTGLSLGSAHRSKANNVAFRVDERSHVAAAIHGDQRLRHRHFPT